MIPKQLQNEKFRFIKLKNNSKFPLEKWKKQENQYIYADSKFLEHTVNYGIICGNGLIVLDLDNENIYNAIKDKLPKTFQVKTTRGYHFYYLCSDINKKIILEKNGIHYGEILTTGQYAVGPGSVIDGNKRVVLNRVDIATVTKAELQKIIKDYSESLKQKKTPIAELKKGVSEGKRNISAFKLAKKYRNKGLDIEDTTNLILVWNRKNSPPTDEQELINTVRSVYITHAYDIYFDNNKFLPCAMGKDIVFNGDENKGFYVLKDTKEIIRFDGKRYAFDGEDFIKSEVQEIIGDRTSISNRSEVIECVRNISKIQIDRKSLNANLDLINVRNGVLNWKTGELFAHDKKFLITEFLDIGYNPKAKCPAIEKFFNEIHYPEDIQGIEELFGYGLYKSMPFHKIFIGVGSGENGKSIECALLRYFLGPDNVISKEMISIVKQGERAIADFYGKQANICPDISDRSIDSMSVLKELSGGVDTVTGRKLYHETFQFVNYAKLFFTCNKRPIIRDDTDATWRRIQPIEYPNKFTGDKCDHFIFNKLCTDSEMSGLLNLSINALKRLLETRKFHFKITDQKEIREDYKSGTEPLYAFVKHLCEDVSSRISAREIYENYLTYANENNLPQMSRKGFVIELKKYFPKIENRSVNSNSYYYGIKYVDSDLNRTRMPDRPETQQKLNADEPEIDNTVIDESDPEQQRMKDFYNEGKDDNNE